MKRAILRSTAFSLILAFATPAGTAVENPAAARPSVEDFFRSPDVSGLQISPDGKYVGFLTTLATGKVGIALMHLGTGKVEPLVSPHDENVEFFFWKGGDRIIYGGDVEGNESDALRSFSISKRKVTAIAESFRERYGNYGNWASIVSTLPYDPEHILVYADGYATVNVNTGKRWTFQQIHGFRVTQQAFPARKGTILARVRDEGEQVFYEVRPDGKSPYRLVAKFAGTDAGWSFLEIGGDDETLYVLTNDKTDTPELHTINVRTGELSPGLFRPETGEIVSIILSEDGLKLYGVVYEDEKHHYHWFDDARAKVQALIDAALPGTFNRVVSSSLDEQLLVIRTYSDRDPGAYYLLDRRAGRLMPLGRGQASIDPKLMRPMEPIRFTARDGLVIHGYLTRPASHENSPAPLIVMPHGGPFTIRDSWGYNPEVQFLASRGYAVLQVNFRGSGGYGASFIRAGWKEWGGKMQDDLTDAVKWTIDTGAADPARIAIFGASYGGYAALAGVTFTPDLYRCAINYVGVADLKILKRWGLLGSDATASYLEHWVGIDPEYQRQRSPVNFVERIKVPTMHIYGFNDPRVDIDHWKRLRARLVEHGKPFEEMIQKDEGHGFFNDESRIELYRRIEAFLATHMPADE